MDRISDTRWARNKPKLIFTTCCQRTNFLTWTLFLDQKWTNQSLTFLTFELKHFLHLPTYCTSNHPSTYNTHSPHQPPPPNILRIQPHPQPTTPTHPTYYTSNHTHPKQFDVGTSSLRAIESGTWPCVIQNDTLFFCCNLNDQANTDRSFVSDHAFVYALFQL